MDLKSIAFYAFGIIIYRDYKKKVLVQDFFFIMYININTTKKTLTSDPIKLLDFRNW